MKRRPYIEWVADMMEISLREKDNLGYPGWESMSLTELRDKLIEERNEVDEEIINGRSIVDLQKECVHEAITAMFVAAHYDEGMKRLERGFEV